MYSCKYNRWKIIKVKFTKLCGRISEVKGNKNDISVHTQYNDISRYFLKTTSATMS